MKNTKAAKNHVNNNDFHEKSLKPMQITSKNAKEKTTAGEAGNVRIETPSVDKHSPLTRPHSFASPARTHDTNTKRNRNQFPDWGSPASINSPQSPMCVCISSCALLPPQQFRRRDRPKLPIMWARMFSRGFAALPRSMCNGKVQALWGEMLRKSERQ